MKLEKASITILVGYEKTTIEIKDHTSTVTFVKVELTPEQLSMALSRQMHTPCKAEVFGLEKLGKKHENKNFEFMIPNKLRGSTHSESLLIECKSELKSQGMSEWIPDSYFGSQDSFFTRDGQDYARAIIRRWV